MKQLLLFGTLIALVPAAWAGPQTDTPSAVPNPAQASAPESFAQQNARAEEGAVDAQYAIAIAYAEGKGVVANPRESVAWYEKAAENGHVEAQFKLATIYERGESGIKRNPSKAVDWYRRAAQNGHVESQWRVSQLYEDGRGTAQNLVEAYKWASVALKNAGRDSELYRQGTRRVHALRWRMPNEQFAKAEQWIVRWQPREK